ncbi:cysteine dioxygenase [Paludisphaera rhizosphaerae]|uniref:cysteine dioxygenase n=1 Tax=Paludisphaera rhizosphaerae TaxID=2711216 RepID=UPI0013EA0737|nr:cysteine dioxygenase family protein [Paludisphaera rhizosphaerae]
MKRQRGFQGDRLRRLLQSGFKKPAVAGRSPHIEVPGASRSHLNHPSENRREDSRARVVATLERWARLKAYLPEELIRHGLVAMRANREALGAAVQFGDGCQRACIFACEHFEVLVACRTSGQGGPIHDHGGSICGLLVVEGTATEIVFEETGAGLLSPSRSHNIPEGAVSVSRNGDVHMLANLQSEGTPLITLHVCSPPLTARHRFRLGETAFSGLDEVVDEQTSTRSLSI